MKDEKTELQLKLFALQDLKYKEFHSRLMPTINPDVIIGVRTPALRKFAKEVRKQPYCEEFLRELPHQYYEENNLHGFLIEAGRDYEQTIKQIDAFLPYVDNWATCDLINPKILGKHLPQLLEKIQQWIASEQTYTIRFGIEMLMRYYLDDAFQPEYLSMVSKVLSQEYYVNMMIAWYFATALAKQYEAAIPYLQEEKMDQWVHNKTIQKAVESYRITEEQKIYLKQLRRK